MRTLFGEGGRVERHKHPVQAGPAERHRAGDPPRAEGDRETRRPHRYRAGVGEKRDSAVAALNISKDWAKARMTHSATRALGAPKRD
jgi:hypothetical protein